MHKNSPEILELRHQIEEAIGRRIKTSTDFTFLSGAIWERTHENISASTLKRLWGYVSGADTIRNSTLEIMSKFLGFTGWDNFLEYIAQDNGSDFTVEREHTKTEELNVGNVISVSWKPNRHCKFRYLGENNFVVEHSENSKLKEGDTFRCSIFILGEPLFLTNLIQDGKEPVTFKAGNKGGLCSISIE